MKDNQEYNIDGAIGKETSFELSLTLGMVLRGRPTELEKLLSVVQEFCRTHQVGLIYKKIGKGKLWVMEGEPPEDGDQE